MEKFKFITLSLHILTAKAYKKNDLDWPHDHIWSSCRGYRNLESPLCMHYSSRVGSCSPGYTFEEGDYLKYEGGKWI